MSNKFLITRFVRWIKHTKEKRHSKVRAFYYKALLLCIEVYAMVLLGMSYYLAWMGNDIVLEDLSKTIVKMILYPFIAFTINRTVENFAEHNITQFHKPLSETPIEESEDSL